MHHHSFISGLCWLLSTLTSASCASGQGRHVSSNSMLAPYQTERFRLSASPGSAPGYPSTIDEGRFITSDGGSFPVPWGHALNSGWGGTAVGWAVGSEMQPAPDSLEIRWFSYTEDKFYEGHFLLPQQHLYELLKRGFWDSASGKQATYHDLAVCVAPTGVVYVWLSAGQSNKLFIGRYQAHEIQYDYAQHRPKVDRAASVREARASLTPEVKHEIATNTISSKKWDNYLKTYSWQLGFSQPLTVTDLRIRYLNAATSGDPPTADLAAHVRQVAGPSLKPIPASWMLYVAGPYGRKRLFKVKPFDESEVQAAFQTLHARYPGEALTLFIDTDERLSKATLSLRAGGQVVQLPKSKLQPFDL